MGSVTALTSARTYNHTTIENSATKGNPLHTISYDGSSQKKLGIEGYKLPKYGLPPRNPNYSVPKDKLSNFLEMTQRRAKLLPAPNQYHKPLTWSTSNGNFGKNSRRKTFTDEVMKISKEVPSSATYDPHVKDKVLLGLSKYGFNVLICP